MKQLLTTDQAAYLLNVSRQTLLRWRRARTGPPHIKVGRRWHYDPDDIAAWLEQQKAGAYPTAPERTP